MKDSKITVMFAVLLAATLALALVSVSYTESVSAHHKGGHDNGCGSPGHPNQSCDEDGLGEDPPGDDDPDPDLDPPGEDDD